MVEEGRPKWVSRILVMHIKKRTSIFKLSWVILDPHNVISQVFGEKCSNEKHEKKQNPDDITPVLLSI